jgi:hypothetical protein
MILPDRFVGQQYYLWQALTGILEVDTFEEG